MKAFQFRLQVVLDQKKRIEEMAQKEYFLVLARRQEINDVIRRQEDQIRDSFRLSNPEVGKSFYSHELIRDRRFLVTLQLELENLFEHKKMIEKELEKKRLILAEASKKRQVLTRLKERRYEEWRREILRLEQWEMDEIAGNVVRIQKSGAP